MSINTGTLISATIRPLDSLDQIATAFANEVKGGHHGYETLAERDALFEARREWGMLVTIYSDGSNNGTYQLTYNYVDTDLTNNSNWILFSGAGGSAVEWYDSVLTRTNVEPATASVGDRYLITSVGTGHWFGNEGKLTEWISSGTWSYTTPTNGSSVRVDDELNSIYRYDGTHPSGTWNQEIITQVRYISATGNGLTYSATSTTDVVSYTSNVLFLTNFQINNSASASININSLGDVYIKKHNGLGSLVDLDPDDLRTGVIYQLVYDGTYFQTTVTGASSASGVIGPAEDGDYTDGLFTDFTPTTPIGTPIDRFNEILKSLVPPSAPVLSDWSGSKSGTVSNGKLSFDGSNPIAGGNYSSATASTSPVAVDGSWTASGKRLGIAPATGNLSGTLNDQVTIHGGLPTPSYIADSFGDAHLGLLRMYINGTELVSAQIDLTGLSASDTTSGGSISGFNISAATASKFPGGDNFENFQNRTGTWLVIGSFPSSIGITQGYNYIHVVHDNSPSFTRTLDRYEFILDDNVTSTSITSGTVSSFTMSGSNYLSGINYYTGGSIQYDVIINNLYRNTYYSGGDAITFIDNCTGDTAPILGVTASLSLANSNGEEGKTFSISNADQNGSALTFSIISSGKRRINEDIAISVLAKRTVQGTASGGAAYIYDVVLDNIVASSTDYVEDFNDENYRLVNTYGGFQYDLITNILTNPWDSEKSLVGTYSGYNDGLQVVNGELDYPNIDWSSIGQANTNLNYGQTWSNYSGATGSRSYIRYFLQTTPTTGNFIMTINGSGGTFVPLTTPLTGNNIYVEIKAPGSSAEETGWLDAYEDFATGMWIDGDGARNSVDGIGRAFGVDWGLTIGTKNTADTSGYMLLRITTGASFSGSITGINWEFV